MSNSVEIEGIVATLNYTKINNGCLVSDESNLKKHSKKTSNKFCKRTRENVCLQNTPLFSNNIRSNKVMDTYPNVESGAGSKRMSVHSMIKGRT